MKGILKLAVVAVLGITLSTPVLAGHHGSRRGHSRCHVRGGYHTVYYAPYPRPRPRTSLYVAFGAPVYSPVPAYYYGPAPVPVAPVYYRPVWVPEHYVYDHGARIFVAGHWSR